MEKTEEKDMPLFSIVIPSYNHAAYVLECLNSIKMQKYSNIELVIIDDCSTDDTYRLEQQWVAENTEIFENRIILQQNKSNSGVVKTVNKALKLCSGDYIIRLASDDCLLAAAVEKAVEIYSQNSQYGMICFDGLAGENFKEALGNSDNIPTMYHGKNYNQIEKPFEELYKEDYIAAPGCVIKRDTYLKLGLYDEKTWIDDWEYYLRITKNFPILFSFERIVFFRQVADSLSHSPSIAKRKMMNQGVLYVLEKYKSDIPPAISKKVMKRQANQILREVLEWNDEDYLNYIFQYMKRNNIHFTFRAFAKRFLMKNF